MITPFINQIGNSTFSPIKLFLEADIVVQLVMIGLILASLWTWALIISYAIRLNRIDRQTSRFEREFWSSQSLDQFQNRERDRNLSIDKVMAAGLREWQRSSVQKNIEAEGLRQRLATVMNSTIAGEIDKLSDRTNFLATVGSVAPFIGLFGTVWGIMRSFSAIAQEQSSSLAVVAPGIAEALFATAIGLFAAIPAVIAYNRVTHRINQLDARMGRFADLFHAMLSREIETGKER